MNEPNKIIPPTIGQQVHFHLASSNVSHISGWGNAPNNTYAATVAFVHSDRLVNLSVIDAGGYTYGMESIPLRQPDDERPLGNWCEWPPHLAAMSRPPGRVPTLQSTGEPATLNQVHTPNDPGAGGSVAGSYLGENIRHPAIAATQQLDNDGNALELTEVGTVTETGQAAPTIPQD